MREILLIEIENDIDFLKKLGCDGFGSWRGLELELSMEIIEFIVGFFVGFF